MSVENSRLIANLAIIGVIHEIDESAHRARVDADGMITDWLPWGERRAGPGMRTCAMPEVGEQVLLVCPYGDPNQAVIVCSVPQDAYPVPADKKTIHRTTYADGSVVEYDRESHKLTVNVGSGSVVVNCAKAEVHAADSVLIETPSAKVTGDLEIGGNTTMKGDATVQGDTAVKAIKSNGKDIGDTHKHLGVQTGGGVSGTPQ